MDVYNQTIEGVLTVAIVCVVGGNIKTKPILFTVKTRNEQALRDSVSTVVGIKEMPSRGCFSRVDVTNT